jgi:ATP-dependent phosphofructokinase / diphosphate-dependent phosphofructokinase
VPKEEAPPRVIGVLTAGGDCQGLNAAIRGVAKAAGSTYGMEVVGFHDGFRGLVENRFERLTDARVSGILTLGGTILGTSRDKPHKMPVGNATVDMTAQAVENYQRLHLDALVCIGGGGTQKNALRLMRKGGLCVVTLPKTIDNDVAQTDVCFGYDTAVQIATEAIDRLHSTASSHSRVMLVEIMGHNTGWLTAAAGLAGGADVVLIPEIPYRLDKVGQALVERHRRGKRFSIVAIAEGAVSAEDEERIAKERRGRKPSKAETEGDADEGGNGDEQGSQTGERAAAFLSRRLPELTGLETRLTALGHVMRGGSPSAADRILATQLGSKAVELLAAGVSGVMVAVRGRRLEPVPLEQVAGQRHAVPLDHPLLQSLRMLNISLGI